MRKDGDGGYAEFTGFDGSLGAVLDRQTRHAGHGRNCNLTLALMNHHGPDKIGGRQNGFPD